MNSTPNPAETGGAAFCAACGTALSQGARFCHRCGTPAGLGASAPTAATTAPTAGSASVLPWAVAFVALLALVAMVAGRNFGSTGGSSVDGSANSLPTSSIDGMARGNPPDISSLSPSEQASMLYNRVMTYAERGAVDSVAFFAPMALGAHEMLTTPTIDERYHFGRVAEVIGDSIIARAQADTILAQKPESLLGLMLAATAARMVSDTRAASAFDQRFLAALESELSTGNQDYELHRPEIDRAANSARSGSRP